ncbi:MAG: acyl-CoA dehydrogenase family protein [Anaerolineales bacterium]|jgi:acyl-CoA dehydrogenase|nr:acyl-CoA dehydrogenase family protein [Anaerolineales bacterium]MDX9937421.1 acyl-CoA dehydrogenase family protein [Anaerolineales bacterium]WKZ55920.1 MAG: acyl-CoA dehydrogenase family protein [Anaerolineales bacterium]GER80534.1 acyl-CoA dehydrogenase [Candidatus Denitrolinea symbiosum]
MTIEFEAPKPIAQTQFVLKTVAEEMMRSKSRYFDDHEHEIPWDYIEFMHTAMKAMGAGSLAPKERDNGHDGGQKEKRPPIAYQSLAAQIEMLAWGDVGFYLVTPGGGLGAAAVQAAGTPEQKAKFLARFMGEKPTLGAMCMTEAGAGSDTSSIRTRAVLDEKTNEWILNGEKIFVTAGDKAFNEYEKLGKGFLVVWASIDPAAGRAGMRSFVVEGGTPGVKVTKLEEKLGIRASDTAAISLVDARVPFDHILGSPTVEKTTKGFKGAMATFDATRPLVAASGLGVARAALEFLKEKLAENGVEIRYGLPRQKLTNIEREVIDCEIMLKSAWLMVLKAVWMADNKQPNALESSMSKVKAGDVGTKITQKAVEILGPLGYSREFLLEKWFRDAKITDIYEGTGQINRLVVARQILGYSGAELR